MPRHSQTYLGERRRSVLTDFVEADIVLIPDAAIAAGLDSSIDWGEKHCDELARNATKISQRGTLPNNGFAKQSGCSLS